MPTTRARTQKEASDLEMALRESVADQGFLPSMIVEQNATLNVWASATERAATLEVTGLVGESLISEDQIDSSRAAVEEEDPSNKLSETKKAKRENTKGTLQKVITGRIAKGGRKNTVKRTEQGSEDEFVLDGQAVDLPNANTAPRRQPRRSVRERKLASESGNVERPTNQLPEGDSKKSRISTLVKKEKVQYTNDYRVKLGYTRFVDGTGPSKEAINEVFDILRDHHAKDGLNLTPDDVPGSDSNIGPLHAAGELTVDAFVLTILAQSTTNQGGLVAHWVLRYFFPFIINGHKVMGKKPNYHAMRRVELGKLIDILRPAGLQTKRAQMIKSILDAVYEGNKSRAETAVINPRTVQSADVKAAVDAADFQTFSQGVSQSNVDNMQGSPSASTATNSSPAESPKDSSLSPGSDMTEVTVPDETLSEWVPPSGWIKHGDVLEPPEGNCPDYFAPGLLSVKYLEALDNQALVDELLSNPGIGVKTAFCIGSFNLRRPLFAVDTHVFRMCKFLGWSPAGVDENSTCELLDFLIDDNKKLALHQAFWHHGQICGRCKSGATERSDGWEKGCPLDHLIDRKRFVPQLSKVQKERQAERAVQKAERDAALAEKAAARAEAKAKKQKAAAGQLRLEFRMTEGRLKVGTKRTSDSEDVAVGGQEQPRGAKKTKIEETDVTEEVYDPNEYGNLSLHDDFDAGRNQNVRKTIWFKIPKIKVEIDLQV
ncbi:putativegpd family base excision dna repair protein [Phaeomoniella chlamydospora]|uniref:Putativegpd family base excision dna repair protein n=1 Tax=Phaeomoniella chlamydospora TaxID=158046 RepID=A0A0G2DWI6_PHACM|nr:putativegpd family base excision dna repair protein [Phaeomoniella chlamydospora]